MNDLLAAEERVRDLADKIRRTVMHPWRIMEVCGGQTHAILRHGLEELLPPGVELLHGPGCPVCVTGVSLIDCALELAKRKDMILCSYGDMLRVPGTCEDMLSVRAGGGQVRVLYSPLDAVKLAMENPSEEVVFFAVGFETTAPASALAVLRAEALGITNFSLLSAHVLVPPSLSLLMESGDDRPDAFLAPGHVCAVTGEGDYRILSSRYGVPMAVTGFEPEDILRGLLCCLSRLERGEPGLDNAYTRAVRPEGNAAALEFMRRVFMPEDCVWRGLGMIPRGGLKLRPEYARFDAVKRFSPKLAESDSSSSACRAGDVLRGRIKPSACPAFGTACTPLTPLGAPMVSSEGACASYYRFRGGETPHPRL